MKYIVKSLSVIIIIAYHSYTLGMLSALPIFTSNADKHKTDHVLFLSALSVNYFCYAPQKENVTGNTENLPDSNIRLLFNCNREITKTTKLLFDNEFNQYSRFSGNLLIQYSKTLIIFPFNYFW